MARKRKTDAAPRLDEPDGTLYSTFCSAANSLSQLYSQAVAQQKQSFHAGELHALEKLHKWILRKYEEESRLTVADIMAHVHPEMDYGGSDANITTRGPQYPQVAGQFGDSNSQLSAAGAFAPRALNSEQSKSSIFSNVLTSPVRWSLQRYHPAAQGQGAANGVKNTNESNSGAQNGDTTMEMVSDSPANEFD